MSRAWLLREALARGFPALVTELRLKRKAGFVTRGEYVNPGASSPRRGPRSEGARTDRWVHGRSQASRAVRLGKCRSDQIRMVSGGAVTMGMLRPRISAVRNGSPSCSWASHTSRSALMGIIGVLLLVSDLRRFVGRGVALCLPGAVYCSKLSPGNA